MTRGEQRRRAILEAALGCFASAGIAATTIADIRERAGATTGSVYHLFDGKDAIVGALYVQVLDTYQRGLIERLRRHRTARAGVRAIVEHYLDWVEANPDAARFLFDARRSEAVAAAEADIAALNRALFAAVRDWLGPHIEHGLIRQLPTDVLIAVLVGPAAAFARDWLAGHTRSDLARARPLLAAAAWAALRSHHQEDAT